MEIFPEVRRNDNSALLTKLQHESQEESCGSQDISLCTQQLSQTNEDVLKGKEKHAQWLVRCSELIDGLSNNNPTKRSIKPQFNKSLKSKLHVKNLNEDPSGSMIEKDMDVLKINEVNLSKDDFNKMEGTKVPYFKPCFNKQESFKTFQQEFNIEKMRFTDATDTVQSKMLIETNTPFNPKPCFSKELEVKHSQEEFDFEKMRHSVNDLVQSKGAIETNTPFKPCFSKQLKLKTSHERFDIETRFGATNELVQSKEATETCKINCITVHTEGPYKPIFKRIQKDCIKLSHKKHVGGLKRNINNTANKIRKMKKKEKAKTMLASSHPINQERGFCHGQNEKQEISQDGGQFKEISVIDESDVKNIKLNEKETSFAIAEEVSLKRKIQRKEKEAKNRFGTSSDPENPGLSHCHAKNEKEEITSKDCDQFKEISLVDETGVNINLTDKEKDTSFISAEKKNVCVHEEESSKIQTSLLKEGELNSENSQGMKNLITHVIEEKRILSEEKIEELVLSDKLEEANVVSLVYYLKRNGIICKKRDRKPILIEKVKHVVMQTAECLQNAPGKNPPKVITGEHEKRNEVIPNSETKDVQKHGEIGSELQKKIVSHSPKMKSDFMEVEQTIKEKNNNIIHFLNPVQYKGSETTAVIDSSRKINEKLQGCDVGNERSKKEMEENIKKSEENIFSPKEIKSNFSVIVAPSDGRKLQVQKEKVIPINYLLDENEPTSLNIKEFLSDVHFMSMKRKSNEPLPSQSEKRKPIIFDDSIVEELASLDQLQKANVPTLLDYLKKRGVACKGKEKKESLMEKVKLFVKQIKEETPVQYYTVTQENKAQSPLQE